MLTKSIVFIILFKSAVTLYVDDPCILHHDKSPGICKLNTQCQIAIDMLRYKRIRPTTCGFSGFQPILCCPISNMNLKDKVDKELNSKSERISVRKCNEYKKCEKYRGTREIEGEFHITVVGGQDASPGAYPHMAAIGWALADGSGYKWNCGGSLISDYYVLTAGHCSYARDESFRSPEPTIVKLGQNDLKETDPTKFQDIEIDRIIKHPNYTTVIKYHDIALLKLKKAPIYIDGIKPVCLWQTKYLPNVQPIATGWGRLGFTENPSDYLQDVVLDIVDEETCKNFYKIKRSLPQGISSEQLCAGDINGNKDTCQGDSGGPLLIRDPDMQCFFHLIGVTSFGVGCGGENSPAVYTRVSSYIDWIESVVWAN